MPNMKLPPSLVHKRYASPLGTIVLGAGENGLALCCFDDHRALPALMQQQDAHAASEHAVLRQASRQLKEYFEGQRQHFDLPLDLSHGTAFQQSVWQALLKIGYGHTCCYTDVANAIAKPSAVRAVGAAVGANPLSLLVPCHRVIGADGSLTGYAGGLERKTFLLQLESGHSVGDRAGSLCLAAVFPAMSQKSLL
jgi:methylated-DNA-[protein]-cysteine S-methyltransferase